MQVLPLFQWLVYWNFREFNCNYRWSSNTCFSFHWSSTWTQYNFTSLSNWVSATNSTHLSQKSPSYLSQSIVLANSSPTSFWVHDPFLFEPKTLKTTLKDFCWINSMKDELQVVHDNNTWELVPQPYVINVVTSKWVYRIKYKENSFINCFKAHLVVKVSHKYQECTIKKLWNMWLNQPPLVLS